MQPEYCLFGINTWWTTCMPRSDWAAWVQGLGSIAAILVAIYISRGEVRRAHREQKDRADSLRRLALIFADDIRHACTLRSSDFEFAFDSRRNAAIKVALEKLVVPLAQAPIWEIHDSHMASLITSISYQVGLATHSLGSEDASALNTIENLQATCEKLIARYGPVHATPLPSK